MIRNLTYLRTCLNFILRDQTVPFMIILRYSSKLRSSPRVAKALAETLLRSHLKASPTQKKNYFDHQKRF